jgi:hypothetical protein
MMKVKYIAMYYQVTVMRSQVKAEVNNPFPIILFMTKTLWEVKRIDTLIYQGAQPHLVGKGKSKS